MVRLLFHLFRRLRVVRGVVLLKVGLLTLAILAYSASGFMFFELEHKPDLTWPDAIWWSLVTMTTVGYGDYFPVSFGGRYLVGVPAMIFGISVLGYLLSTVAAFLIEARSKELRGMANTRLSGHILVVHHQSVDRFLTLLKELRSDRKTRAATVVLIDDDLDELPPELRLDGVKFVHGDPTHEDVLERASFREASHAILLSKDPKDSRSDDHNLAVVLTLEQLHPELQTVAECVDPGRVGLLKRAGCDSVVCLAELTSALLVSEVLDPGVQAVLHDLTSNDGGHQIYVVPIEKLSAWRYAEVQAVLSEMGFLALGLKRDGRVLLNPKPGFEVDKADHAVCIGSERPKALVAA